MKSGRTIQEMAVEIQRQGEAKADYMVDTRCLHMEIWDNQPYLLALNESGHDLMEPLDIQTTAHRQLSTYLDIPIKYYEKMRLHDPDLLAQNVNRWLQRMQPAYRMLRTLDGHGRPLKVVDQKLFDKAAEQGFPSNFFRETYFDQVTLYCLPEHADFYGSTFQNCTFAVCRINAASFIGTSIYSSEFHSCVLEHTDFFKATLAHTHFHDCSLFHVTFQAASLKSCNTIDCTLDQINYLIARLDGCSFGRATASNIRNLMTATIIQGGATAEECQRNKESIFQALGVEQEGL